MGPVMQHIGEKPVDPLTIHYYPSAKESSFELYEDDGETKAHERGEFAVTKITASAQKGAKTFLAVEAPKGKYRGMPEKRNYEIILHGCAKPSGVSISGKAAKFAYDEKARAITVKVPATAAGFSVEAAF